MDDERKEVRVIDMCLGCVYAVVSSPGTAPSRCLRMAHTAVQFPDGSISWRCMEHRGLTIGDDVGPVSETMFTTMHVSENVVLSRPKR